MTTGYRANYFPQPAREGVPATAAEVVQQFAISAPRGSEKFLEHLQIIAPLLDARQTTSASEHMPLLKTAYDRIAPTNPSPIAKAMKQICDLAAVLTIDSHIKTLTRGALRHVSSDKQQLLCDLVQSLHGRSYQLPLSTQKILTEIGITVTHLPPSSDRAGQGSKPSVPAVPVAAMHTKVHTQKINASQRTQAAPPPAPLAEAAQPNPAANENLDPLTHGEELVTLIMRDKDEWIRGDKPIPSFSDSDKAAIQTYLTDTAAHVTDGIKTIAGVSTNIDKLIAHARACQMVADGLVPHELGKQICNAWNKYKGGLGTNLRSVAERYHGAIIEATSSLGMTTSEGGGRIDTDKPARRSASPARTGSTSKPQPR